MNLKLGFHPLVQRDLNEILDYYVSEAGHETADRFESEFRVAIATIQKNPLHFPFYQKQRRYRRCKLSTFPHLILYREENGYLRVMVLKHVRRSPSFGLRRR
jgi:plasmid stabilization system protein ParE